MPLCVYIHSSHFLLKPKTVYKGLCLNVIYPIPSEYSFLSWRGHEWCERLVWMMFTTFKLTNGTIQGSVFSPTLFSVYLDDLLKMLRQTGLGCCVESGLKLLGTQMTCCSQHLSDKPCLKCIRSIPLMQKNTTWSSQLIWMPRSPRIRPSWCVGRLTVI